jgi:UDP-N-acetylmuramate--alanine ligase
VNSTTANLAPAHVPLPQPVHFIGIGGVGMSGIARILVSRGVRVSGSDAKESRNLVALRALGADVQVGHHPAHLARAASVVVSTAVRADNPELLEARRLGLPVVPRAAALAAVMAGRRGVAVSGTAGKTTTTSMLTVALQHCGLDPSFAIGGDLNEPGSNAHAGFGELFVAEADESDRSFLLLSPFAAVVTNVAADHLDHYRSVEEIEGAFNEFVTRVDPGGFVVYGADDPGAVRVAAAARAAGRRTVSYGFARDATARLDGLVLAGERSRFDLVLTGRRLGPVSLIVPGRHNASNAAAALTAGLELGCPFGQLAAGLAEFTGARRRFEAKGAVGGIRVVDDYAHHPMKLHAVLTAARGVVPPGGRLVAIFQPQRYTRTAAFGEGMAQALALADLVVVMEVYAAGEDPIPGVTGAAVAAAVPLPPERVIYEPSWSAVPGLVATLARPGDLVMTLGAGDVTLLGPEILDRLAGRG